MFFVVLVEGSDKFKHTACTTVPQYGAARTEKLIDQHLLRTVTNDVQSLYITGRPGYLLAKSAGYGCQQ